MYDMGSKTSSVAEKTVLETDGGGVWAFRRYDAAGKLIQEVDGAVPVSEVCRRLGKSRRQVYRYLAQGYVVPVGKFLGEWLVQARGIEYLQGRPRRPKLPLPESMQVLFPEYKLAQLHPICDASVIVPRVMEQGDRRETAWLLKQYSKPWLTWWMKREGWHLSPRAARFWSWWLGVPLPGPRIIPPLPKMFA